MRLFEIIRNAEEFGVTLNQAIGARRAYLWREWEYYLNADVDPVTWDVICLPTMEGIIKELYQLKQDMVWHNRPKKEGEVTEEMKDRAKAYPVTRLVEFTKGRALAWCHADKRPSLYVASRINKVVCPVCDLKLDPIDILRTRDGMNYYDAIRSLQG